MFFCFITTKNLFTWPIIQFLSSQRFVCLLEHSSSCQFGWILITCPATALTFELIHIEMINSIIELTKWFSDSWIHIILKFFSKLSHLNNKVYYTFRCLKWQSDKNWEKIYEISLIFNICPNPIKTKFRQIVISFHFKCIPFTRSDTYHK